uniref:HECT-type E3 ubiquitin transferase n=1 Tax=Seriola lalandi dorsalis TaxID=1841481 RepID=A0A3B4XBX7_SERLL
SNDGRPVNFIFVTCRLVFLSFRLPISHTCFNQICLPPYRTRKELKHKLTIAISNAEGFGLE